MFSPRDHATACSRPLMILSPTVDRLFAVRLAAFFAVPEALPFVFIAPSYFSAGYPVARIGIKRFIALRSALLRFAFSFFGYADSRKSGKLPL